MAIAVLGMGLLGSGFAANLLRHGHPVRVWNRTRSKCAPLGELGAAVADDPAEAVAGVERVHLVLAEDTAVDAVIEALLPGLGAGVAIVDHSTNLPASVVARTAKLAADGIRYLHAPVFMAPANAHAGTGLMLASGPEDLIAELRPHLEQMTGKVLDLGTEPGRAATLKLCGNGVLVALAGIMGDLYKVGAANGVPAEDVVALFDAFKPGAAGLGRRVLNAGSGPASFELSMARKDVRLMIEAAGGPEGLSVLPGVAAAMDASISAGNASVDFGIFAKP